MYFLVNADLPRQTSSLCHKYKHEAEDVRDIGLGRAVDASIAAYSKQHKICILTGDFGFADIRNYLPSEYFGIVVFEFPRNANREARFQLIEKLLNQSEILDRLPGRLAIVSADQIRLRPS